MNTKKATYITLTTILLCTLYISLKAQGIKETSSTSPFLTIDKQKMFKPIVSMETWATYSMGEEKNGTKYADRGDVSFRRFRFGASGNPFSWLKYSLELNADRLGEDPYAATKGSYNGIGIWKAYITAKLLKDSEFLNLEAGYFWAVISRESNTSPWAVASFDKTRASWFLRSFNTGKGNGIISGIALGGIKNYDNFGISYRIGTYEPEAYQNSKYGSRLYTGRFMFSVGDPEQKAYKYMQTGNHWKKRNGLTIGFGAATMSNGAIDATTDTYFDKSNSYGADLAIDLSGLRIDGEYYKMKRTMDGADDFEGKEMRVCFAYNFIVNKKYLEPTITYNKYEGEGNKTLFKHIGRDETFDIGINYYLSKSKLKLSLHYLTQGGSASSNQGDYIGLACQFKL